MQRISGTVDFRDDHFVVSCQFDVRVHAALRALPKQQYEEGVWLVPKHLKSVAGLLAVARKHEWPLTRRAQRARSDLQAAADEAEFFVQLVHGAGGEPVLKCRADDLDLEGALDAISGAERDDEPNTWNIPGGDPAACEQVEALVGSDSRFSVDDAARRLLDHPEDCAEFVRIEAESRAAAPSLFEPVPAAPVTAHEITAAFEREQELLAWSSAVIADAEAGPLESLLRPFQRAGIRYLRSAKRAFLADDLGLGKSVQALAAIEAESAYPALIICSAALEAHWESEIGRWLPRARTCSVVADSMGTVPDTDVVVVDYEMLHRRRDELRERGFQSIVADDSFQLRSERSLKTRAALEIAETVQGLKFCLSSTALFEQPIHLLPQLLFLGRIDDLQGRNAFVERYCRPRHDVSGTRYGASHIAELEQRLRACCLCRRERSQVALQLPTLPRYQHAVRATGGPSLRAREASLLSRMRLLRDAADEVASRDQRSANREELRACLDELLVLTGESKISGVAAWIDHFILSGEWLAVVVRSPTVMAAFEQRFADALFVRAPGTCLHAGAPVNAFFAADAKLVFLEEGSRGAVLRMVRGRHVAHAELGAGGDTARFLLEAKSGEYAGAVWDLVSDMAVDQALRALAMRAPSGRDALADDELDLIVQELVGARAEDRAGLVHDARLSGAR